jgi:hypothetical protein
MSDISTKKTIEIWGDDLGLKFRIQTSSNGVSIEFHSCGINDYTEVIDPMMIGPLCKALHEVAQNVIENTREDDGEA